MMIDANLFLEHTTDRYEHLTIPEIISELDHSYENMKQEFLKEGTVAKVAVVGALLLYHKQVIGWLKNIIDLFVSFRMKVLDWFGKARNVAVKKIGADLRTIQSKINASKKQVVISPEDPRPYDYRKTYKNKIKASAIRDLIQRFDSSKPIDVNSPETLRLITATLGIGDGGDSKSLNGVISRFVNGPKITNPITYSSKDAKFFAQVLANGPIETTEIEQMFDAIIKELKASEKALNSKLSQNEINSIRDKANVIKIIGSEYVSARLAMHSQVQSIAFKLTSNLEED